MRKPWFILLVIFFPLITYGQNNCKEIGPLGSEGLLVITRSTNGISRSGFVDLTGKVIIEPSFEEAYAFSSNGLALVKAGGLYGFIDRAGKEIIKPQFDNACSFSEELASVRKSGKYGYVDKDNNEIIKPQFDNAYNFSEGLARIKSYVKINPTQDIVQEQFGYIDKSGKPVIPPIFDVASDFQGGIARVVDSIFGLETYINKSGAVIARQASSPPEVLGVAPSLVEVKIESIPAGARIYLIPKRRIELDSTLPSKEENSLFEFLVSTGMTPTKFKAKQKQYTVLFILNGVRRQTPLDVRPDASNSASVSFQ